MNCIYTHRPFWKCLQVHKTYNVDESKMENQSNLHKVVQKFIGSGEPVPERFETRNCYPLQSTDQRNKIAERLCQLKIITNLKSAPKRLCYVYDDQMTEHRNLYEEQVSVKIAKF